MENILFKKQFQEERLVYALIAFLFLIFMFATSGNKSFWLDEMAQVSFIAVPFKDFLHTAIFDSNESMPLWSFPVFFWYKIAPYGEKWLLLLPELATAVGSYIVAMTGRKISGKWVGLFALIFCCTSSTLILYAGQQFREYGFIFLFSAIAIYFWAKRMDFEGEERNKDIIIYGISLILLFLCHPVTLMVCGSMGVYDLILFLKKRIRFKCAVSYLMFVIICGIYFIRIFTANYIYFTEEASSWIVAPKYADIQGLFRYLTGQQMIVFIIAMLGIAAALAIFTYAFLYGRKPTKENILMGGIVWLVGFSVIITFIYSAHINPDGSMFVMRYFICIMPAVTIICGYSFHLISVGISSNFSKSRTKIIKITFSFFLIIFLGINILPVVTNQVSAEPFREASKWLQSQEDIYDDDVAVLFSCYGPSIKGCREYYFYRLGETKKVNMISQYDKKKMKRLVKYEKIYLLELHNIFDEKIKSKIKEHYNFVSEKRKESIKVYERK